MSENPETAVEKGNRHENEAKDIHKRVYGAGIEKVDAYANHDPFGFVDLIGIHPGKPVKFVQVKTNQFTAEDKRKYLKRVRNLPYAHAVFEVWVRIDRVGWDVYSFDRDGFEKAAEIHTCVTTEARKEYAKLVDAGVIA